MQPIDMLKALFGDRPFFGGETAGVQTPLVEENLVLTALVSLVARPRQPVRILEVGSWVGFSALTWAHAIDMLSDAGGEVACVDTWEPYFATGDLQDGALVYRRMDHLASSGLAYPLFLHNAATAPVRVPVTALRGRSDVVMSALPSESFDLIYVDGSHYYDAVRADLAKAPRLLRLGGILCGDDLELQIGQISEAEARGVVESDCTRDAAGRWYHPGVTLAVHEQFGPVSHHGRTWFMRKTPGGFIGVDASAARMAVPPHWPTNWQREADKLLRPMA